jgi:hypothetical protein
MLTINSAGIDREKIGQTRRVIAIKKYENDYDEWEITLEGCESPWTFDYEDNQHNFSWPTTFMPDTRDYLETIASVQGENQVDYYKAVSGD